MSEALDLLRALVLEDRRRWGEAATRFQRDDARAILSRSPRLHFLTRPRGASKTTDLAAVVLALLLEDFGPGDAGHVFACDADQAGELLRAAAGLVARTDELAGLVDVQTRRIIATNGASFAVVPADAASAFGLRSRALIFDEFTMLAGTGEHRRLWEAAFSTQPKLDALLVLLGTAGDPASWQARVLEQAKASNAWRVHEVAGPVPWISSAALNEQRRMLTESQYARLHLNVWTAPEDRLTSPDGVRACVTHEGVLGPRAGVSYRIGVDLGVKHDASVIAVAHGEGFGDDRRVIVDRVDAFVPRSGAPVDLAVVEEAIRTASLAYNRAQVVIDPWQGLLLARNLRGAGVSVDEFTFSAQSVGRIALTLYGLLRDHRIGLPDDEALLDELARVRLRETSPGVFRLDHDPDRHDDRAIAVALAAHALAGASAVGPGVVVPPSTRQVAKPKPAARARDSGQPMLVFGDGSRRPVRRGSEQWKLGGRR